MERIATLRGRLWGAAWMAWVACSLMIAGKAYAITNTEAAQAGINFLSADVETWASAQGCAACHRLGASTFGLATAAANGYDMNTVVANGQSNLANLHSLASRISGEQLSSGYWTHFGVYYTTKTSYAAFGLAGYDRYISTRYSTQLVKAAAWALSAQQAAGYWVEDHGSYPTTYGNVPVTARMMVLLSQAKQRVDPAVAATYQAALDRAAAYLRAHIDDGNDVSGMPFNFEISWAIVGLNAAGPGSSGENTTAINTLADRLLAAKSIPSGAGWGRQNAYVADNFNTGISIYALCVAGRSTSGTGTLPDGISWLKRQQAPGGYWTSGGSTDVATTFAVLGLSCFGDYSVTLAVKGVDQQTIDAQVSHPQTVTYDFTLHNRGNASDTYTLSTQGGLPGWAAALSLTQVTLAAGQETALQLTVTAPPGLLPSLSSAVSVRAVSLANPGVSSSALVTTYTNPKPPTTGLPTVTTITNPSFGATVYLGQGAALSATVVDNTGNPIRGPSKGTVTFYVAGIPVGADDNASGDGVFSIPWLPIAGDWTSMGVQDYRAIYSGVAQPPPASNLLGSSASSTLDLQPPPLAPPDVTLCNQARYTREPNLHTGGFVTTRAPRTVITSTYFTLNGGARLPVTPTGSGGTVGVDLVLADGDNLIQLTAVDSNGSRTTKEQRIFLNRLAPVITVNTPAANAVLGSTQVHLNLTVGSPIPTRVWINWLEQTVVPAGAGGGTVDATVDVVNTGRQNLLIRATDAAFNTTETILPVCIGSCSP